FLERFFAQIGGPADQLDLACHIARARWIDRLGGIESATRRDIVALAIFDKCKADQPASLPFSGGSFTFEELAGLRQAELVGSRLGEQQLEFPMPRGVRGITPGLPCGLYGLCG